MADALEAIRGQNVSIEQITLVGGGARSAAVREIAPSVLGVSVHVPQPGEYVADGAARQAAWVLSGGNQPPLWPVSDIGTYTAQRNSGVLARYRRVAAEVAGF